MFAKELLMKYNKFKEFIKGETMTKLFELIRSFFVGKKSVRYASDSEVKTATDFVVKKYGGALKELAKH